MLEALQKALVARFNATAGNTLRALVQGMWESSAPSSVVSGTQSGTQVRDSVLPWIVFDIVLTGLEQDTCSNFFTPLVQFTIYADGDNKTSDGALNIARELLELYGDTVLTLENGYTNIRVDTVGQRKLKDSEKMWQVVIEMTYQLQKDR